MDKTGKISFKPKTYSQKIINLFSSRGFLYATCGWFLLQTSYIALFTRYRIAPDAFAHFNLIKLHAREGLIPIIKNQEGFYFLWEATRHPSTMYHYLLSLIYRVWPFSEEAIILLFRFLNIAMVLAALLILYKLMVKLELPKAARNITLFMLTNTMMFTYLAASINYDNLIILVAMSIFYLVVLFIKESTLKRLLGLLILLAFSGLVKYSFMPLAVPLLFIVLFFVWKNRAKLMADFKTQINSDGKKRKATLAVLGVVLLLLSTFFAERYLVNIIQYGGVRPKCNQIHAIEDCRKSALFLRAESFQQQTPTYDIRMREYPFRWANRMKGTIFAVVAHQSFSQTKIINYGVYFLAGLFALAILAQIRKGSKEVNILLGLSVYFILVLLYVNYKSYLVHGQFGIALQGRYAFPILPILYIVGNYYLFKCLNRRHILTAFYLTAIFWIFLLGGLPSMLFWIGSDWNIESLGTYGQSIQDWLHYLNATLPIFY